MSSCRTVLPRLAQFGEPAEIVPEVANLKIKSHQHTSGKIITRGLSRGARKWGESASKIHIGGQDNALSDEGADGLDLALCGIQDKSVHLPIIEDGTFHRQTPTPDIRGSKTPIPGVGHWTKRGGKLRPASVLPVGYLSEDETPNASKQDLTLTIEGQADPRLLPQRSTIKAWKLHKSPDGGALYPPPSTPDQSHEYEQMFGSIEEDLKQVLLCQSFGITIEKHKSPHGMVATPIFHCPRCFKHWSTFGTSLQNCDNPNQPTKGPDFQLNKRNHFILQKFSQLPSKDKEHIIDVINSPPKSDISLEADVSTEGLLVLKDILTDDDDDDDDNANMFLGSMQDLGSTLIARRASIEVKSQNEQKSFERETKLKSQRSIHKQQEHSDVRKMHKYKQTKTCHTENGSKKKRKTTKIPAKNLKESDDLQNDKNDNFAPLCDDWSSQKGGHFTKEERQSHEHDSARDTMFVEERGKHKPVGKFAFGPYKSSQTTIGLVGPDGGYYKGTHDNNDQFAPHSRLNPDGSAYPLTKGADDLFYPQDDYLTSHDTDGKQISGPAFGFDNHHHHTLASQDAGLESDFLNFKEQEQTNLQKFSTLPRVLTWDHEGGLEEKVPTKRVTTEHGGGNTTANYNLNNHDEEEEDTNREEQSKDERKQETLEVSVTSDDELLAQGREKSNVKKQDDAKEGEEKAQEIEKFVQEGQKIDQEGNENVRSRMESEMMTSYNDALESFSTEQLINNKSDVNLTPTTGSEEIPAKMEEKDFLASQHDLNKGRNGQEDHVILTSSLCQVNIQKTMSSLSDAISMSALPEQESEEITNVSLERSFTSHSSQMLVKPSHLGADQQSTDPVSYGSEFSVTVPDEDYETAVEDDVTDRNTDYLYRDRKGSEVKQESISEIKTGMTRIRKSSIVPNMGSKDILPTGSDSYYDAYASSKRSQKGPPRRDSKAQRRASIDHRGKIKNPAVRNVTGKPDTKAGALKKHMLATPKSLLAQNTSFEIGQKKAKSSQDFAKLAEVEEVETLDQTYVVKSSDDSPTQDSLQGDEEIETIQSEVLKMEDSAEILLKETEEFSSSKQRTQMRRPPKKEKLPVMRERRVKEQKATEDEKINEEASTEGYPLLEELSKEHKNELPEIVRNVQEKADSTPLNEKDSLPRISTPSNKRESSTRIKSATENLEKLSLSKFSKFQINLNDKSLGLDQSKTETNQASFRMTYSTLPGTFDTRKRSSKGLLREKKQSTEGLPSLPPVKKVPSRKTSDRVVSRLDREVDYMVIQKAPSKAGMESSPQRSSTSNSVESEEEEAIWESVSEMWQKHSKEMQRVSALEEFSYLPLTKAFTFSFFEVPFQYVEQNRELKIRGNMVKSMKRPPRMKIKGKKKRPPTADLNKLLEEKRNQVKKQNLVYKLWQIERRTSYQQPIPKLGSF